MIVKESNSYIKDALCAQRDILAWVIEPPLQQGFSLAPGESKRFSIDIPMKDIMGELQLTRDVILCNRCNARILDSWEWYTFSFCDERKEPNSSKDLGDFCSNCKNQILDAFKKINDNVGELQLNSCSHYDLTYLRDITEYRCVNCGLRMRLRDIEFIRTFQVPEVLDNISEEKQLTLKTFDFSTWILAGFLTTALISFTFVGLCILTKWGPCFNDI